MKLAVPFWRAAGGTTTTTATIATAAPLSGSLATSLRWTCRACRARPAPTQPLRAPSPFPRLRRHYSSARAQPGGNTSGAGAHKSGAGNHNYGPGSGGRRRVVLLCSSGGAVAATGAAVLAFKDDLVKGYEATERSGRVVAALTVCVNDYRTTLNARAKLDEHDDAQRTQLLSDCHKRCAIRTLRVLEQNGGIFIKMGQHLSAMNYLLPPEWTTTFIPLQDQCPVSSLESISAMIERDTGAPISAHFSSFSDRPIGAASLAQVHLATVASTGQQVAVKVQHPSLANWAPLDLALTRYTFATLKWFFPEYDLEWLSSEMDVSLPTELDFKQEAANAMRTKAHFARLPWLPLVVPDVIWADHRILVMAYEAGKRPDDLAYLDNNGIDRDEVSAMLARIFNEMIFGKDAALHCDPHAGNIAIRKRTTTPGGGGSSSSSSKHGFNFDIILYDHGLYRDIPQELRRSYAKMWLAVIDGDMDRMRTHSRDVAGITDEEFPLFASAITGRDFSVLSAPAGTIMRARDSAETQHMTNALQDGLLANLVGLLGRVPRIILLILKTNDLTRSLDEGLCTRQGPLRTFLILARYCSRTVFDERVEQLRAAGSLLWPTNALGLASAWMGLLRVELKLEAFEWWVWLKRVTGIQAAGAAV